MRTDEISFESFDLLSIEELTTVCGPVRQETGSAVPRHLPNDAQLRRHPGALGPISRVDVRGEFGVDPFAWPRGCFCCSVPEPHYCHVSHRDWIAPGSGERLGNYAFDVGLAVYSRIGRRRRCDPDVLESVWSAPCVSLGLRLRYALQEAGSQRSAFSSVPSSSERECDCFTHDRNVTLIPRPAILFAAIHRCPRSRHRYSIKWNC